MSKIFKNMIPYWKSIIIIFALLFVQAWCDLALPSYTSDIIDVGIQNNGVEHIVPEALTAEAFETAELFMTDEEADLWESIYEQDGDIYRLQMTSESELNEIDDTLAVPLIMNYQMSVMEDSEVKEHVAKPTGADAGTLEKDTLLSMRDSMEETIDTMGSSLVKSMGAAYAVSCDKAAGIDVEKIQKSYLVTAGLKMVGMALMIGIVTVLVGFFASRVGAGIGRTLREKVFKQVVGFSNAEMDKFSTASLITRSTNDIQQIQMVSVMLLRMVAYAPILGVGGVLKVMQTGAGMGWIIVLAILVILGYVMVLMAVTMPKFQLMQKLVDNINLVSREILTGLSVIRAFGREKKEEDRFDVANKNLTKTMLFTNRVMTFMMPGMMMIMNVLSVGIVWVGAHKIDAGTMQVGAMTAFITYAMMIVMSFLMLTMMSIMLPRAAVAADRIDEVIQTESSIHDAKEPEKVTTHNGVVKFSHVNFKYPGAEEDVLHDIDFTAEPGQTTAIIGSTGCGKSTLVNLIPRLYDVTDGSITLDGKDIRNITMSDLRDEIGFVPQKGVLFSGTIASNLRFGKDDASDEEIAKVEAIVNEQIAKNLQVVTEEMSVEDAKKTGAMALFGEKYGDKVRVVQMKADGEEAFSVELCGGTHVANTGVISYFKIISESGVAAGVRRIEALTGDGLMKHYAMQEELLKEVAKAAKAEPAKLLQKVTSLQEELKALQSENEKLKAKLANDAVGDVDSKIQEVKGMKVLAMDVPDVDMNGLRNLGDQMKEKIGDGVVVLASANGGKVTLLAMATDAAIKKGAHAGNLIKEIASLVGGGGGGRPNMAQAGGKNPAGIPDALAKVVSVVESQLA